MITGASAGIGLAAATALAQAGARVLAAGRDLQRCRAAREQILEAAPDARVTCLGADLAIQSQVRDLAKAIKDELAGQPLDILVNNAGIYASRFTRTPDGIELTLAVNHLAPFLLTHELLGELQASEQGRVITVSSNSHYSTWLDLSSWNHPHWYHGLWAYKVTKLCNLLFTQELARRTRDTRLRAFAVDPGLVNTAIGEKGTDGFARRVWQLRRQSGSSPQVPARTILYLASALELQDSCQLYWRDCLPKLPSRQARDPALAHSLWELSCGLCCIPTSAGEGGQRALANIQRV